MRKLTHMDGRPVAFKREMVLLVEAHESGAGSLVRFGPIESPRDIHVQEEFEVALKEATENDFARAMKSFVDGEDDPVFSRA